MTQKNYTNITITSLPNREMEIIGQITAEKMATMREAALKKFKDSVEIDGFRKGNAPEALVAQRVGDMKLLEEAAEIALSEEYPNILEEHNIDAIGRPEITITKIGIGNPLEFKIKTALMPEVRLGDYKKIAAKINTAEQTPIAVTDAEVEDVILNIRKNMAHEMMHQNGGLDPHDHSHGEIKDEDLPVVDENFIKLLGDFENVDDFKAKIKENIASEKQLKEKDKVRSETLEAIIGASTIDIPNVVIDGEKEKMFAQFQDDLAKSGVGIEDYLKHIGKTADDLKTEWHDTAVKRAKSQIVLNTIAKEEKIAPTEEEVKKEMEHILSHYKDADRFRVRMYVETFMTNDMVLKFLEEIKK